MKKLLFSLLALLPPWAILITIITILEGSSLGLELGLLLSGLLSLFFVALLFLQLALLRRWFPFPQIAPLARKALLASLLAGIISLPMSLPWSGLLLVPLGATILSRAKVREEDTVRMEPILLQAVFLKVLFVLMLLAHKL